MKKAYKVAAIVTGGVAIAALGIGTAAAGTVNLVQAANGTTYGMHNGDGTGQHYGRMGNGQGNDQMSNGDGSGMGAMSGLNLMNVATGTLTDEQQAKLASMAEEEKLAHDVYVTLGDKYPDVWQFSHISQSETRHLDAIRTLLERYDLADPTSGEAVGTFSSTRFQDLYNELVAGATTQQAALQAGVTVEKTDIADLQAAKSGVTAPDVVQVYDALLSGSQRHLAAFSR